MIFQDLPFAIPPMLIAILAMLIMLRQSIKRKGFSAIDLILFACFIWLAALAFEIGADTLSGKIFWNKIQNIGVLTVPIAWHIGSQAFLTTGSKAHFRKIFVLVFYSIGLLLIATNDLHSLIWYDNQMNPADPFGELIFTTGIGFWFLIIISFSLVVISVIPFFRNAMNYRNLYGKQAIVLIMTALLPIIGSYFDIFRISLIPTLEMVPVAILFVAILNIGLDKQLQVGDIVPVVREIIIDNINDGIIVLDSQDIILDHNPTASQIIMRPGENLIGRLMPEIWNERFEFPWITLREQGDSPQIVTAIGYSRQQYSYEVRSKSVQLRPKHVRGSIMILHDITKSIEYEERIKKSLSEKDKLLQEIHHYIKNNLQIVSSLVGLTSHQISDQGLKNIYHESQNRIQVMALIHDKLYQTKSLGKIEFGEYIKEIAILMVKGQAVRQEGTKLYVKSDEIIVDIDTGISCGLILNELISNSLKHAFPKNFGGEIRVVAKKKLGNLLRLCVSDNGVGLPKGFDLKSNPSLGLNLVETLINQLNGRIEIDQSEGTTFILECPLS